LVPIILSNAQDAINAACDQVDGVSNNTSSGASYAWIVGGFILWTLAMRAYSWSNPAVVCNDRMCIQIPET
jgi:hypothetical protein